MKRQRGFTLVELLTVVTILGLVMAMAAMGMRPNRGERVKSAARIVLGSANEARQSAISLHQAARIKLQTGTTFSLKVEGRDPGKTASATNWLATGGTFPLPYDVQLCRPDGATTFSTATPTCPMTAAMNVCFAPSGAVTVVPAGTDCDDTATATGATVYLRTIDGKNQYKMVVFGLTGLARLIDAW